MSCKWLGEWWLKFSVQSVCIVVSFFWLPCVHLVWLMRSLGHFSCATVTGNVLVKVPLGWVELQDNLVVSLKVVVI